ncbi:MAG: nuclear transport factor 2 family protein [Chloroflexota bacterium]
MSHTELIRRYLEAIEAGATGDALAAFFTPDAKQTEFPNRLVPAGATRDLAAILDGAVRGQSVLRSQRFVVHSLIEHGEAVAAEATWTGVLAIPIGSVPAGGEMRARFAMFFTIREGRIATQHNYDCFDPF